MDLLAQRENYINKVCKKCKDVKNLDLFTKRSDYKDGHLSVCKSCMAIRGRQNYAKNPERYRELSRNSGWRNRHKWTDRIKAYYIKNKEHKLAKQKEWRDNAKQAIFNYYGTKCNCCNESNPMFLSIDHINNDGYKHRKELKLTGGTSLYRWLFLNNFPKGFQTLCYNCNMGKRINKGSCPHKNKPLVSI